MKGTNMKKEDKEAAPREKSSAHQNQTTAAGNELFDQAIKSYEHALRTGVRLQEDAARWWTNLFHQTSWTQDWPRQVSSAMSQAIPTAQKNMEESIRLIDQSSKTSLSFFKRAVDAPRSGNTSDMQTHVQEMWQSSLNVLQSNMQAISESQARLMESWTDFVRKGAASASAK